MFRSAGSRKVPIAVLASGNGSNLQALMNFQADHACAYEIALVICNKKNSFALKRAQSSGLNYRLIEHKMFTTRSDFEHALVFALKEHSVEWVILAGFMRILGQSFLEHFEGRTVNLHPSLLPSFKGPQAVEEALDYGVKITGCTVHLVDAKLDSGRILAQSALEILEGETLGDLKSRMQLLEHKLLVETVQKLVG